MNPTGLTPAPLPKAPGLPCRQRGITLIIALISLVALTMAGIALVRSVDTGNVIAGNFAFRQSSLQATDTGVESAFTQLATIAANTPNTAIANQYYPVMQDLDANGVPCCKNNATTVDWTAVPSSTLGSNAEYAVKYVIERLCTGALPIDADAVANSCVVDQSSSLNSVKLGGGGCATNCNGPPAVNYRVTVRVEGPRNTVAMSQAIVAF
jgi:type IV pilus assembly protein PilX